MVLWDRVFERVSAEYPDIQTESLLVDAAAMNFVRRPQSFDVVVGVQSIRDILSDISAIVTGSIGSPPAPNIDPTRRFPSMFEPVHGSGARIEEGNRESAGSVFSAAMMLDHLGLGRAARQIERLSRPWLAARFAPDLRRLEHHTEVVDALLRSIA